MVPKKTPKNFKMMLVGFARYRLCVQCRFLSYGKGRFPTAGFTGFTTNCSRGAPGSPSDLVFSDLTGHN